MDEAAYLIHQLGVMKIWEKEYLHDAKKEINLHEVYSDSQYLRLIIFVFVCPQKDESSSSEIQTPQHFASKTSI